MEQTFEEKLEEFGVRVDKKLPLYRSRKFLVLAIIIGCVLLVGSSTFIYATFTKSQKKSNSEKKQTQETIKKDTTERVIEGQVVCAQVDQSNECPLGIQTETKEVFILENAKDVKVGDTVTIKGTINQTKIAATGGKLPKTVSISSVQQKQSNPQSSGTTTNATQTQPTPTPTLQDSNVDEIVEDASNLNGKVVTVAGYLVSGNIGAEACTFLGICDHSEITVNTSADYNRDPAYDTRVILNTTESEEDYTIGEFLTFQARVTLNGNEVILEKIY